jgi:hypothetical protein
VELDSGVEMGQQVDPELLGKGFLHNGKTAIGAGFRGGDRGPDPGVGFRHRAEIIGRRAVLHVDHAAAYRIDLLVGREHFRAADVVDLDDALALLVDEIDEALETLRECQRLRESGNRAQRFLRMGGARHEDKRERRAGNGHSCDAPAEVMCMFHSIFLLWFYGTDHPLLIAVTDRRGQAPLSFLRPREL